MRQLTRAFFVVIAISLLCGKAIGQPSTAFKELAMTISEPTFGSETVKRAMDSYSDGNTIARKEYERQRVNELRDLSGALEGVRQRITGPLASCYSTYQEIRRLDSNTPDYEGIAKQALESSQGLAKKLGNQELDGKDRQDVDDFEAKALREIGGALVNAYNLSTQKDAYHKSFDGSRFANYDALAPLIKDEYAGSQQLDENDPNSRISISVSPSMAETYVNEWIEVRNDTGKNLTSCSLFVQLSGVGTNAGQATGDRHFHYISYWPAGETRYFWYPTSSFRGVASNESVGILKKVQVSVFSHELWTKSTFEYTQASYDECVKSWAEKNLAPSTFSGRWYADSENLIDPAGFEITYNGDVNAFTVSKIVVQASDGSRTERVWSNDNQWAKGSSGKKWICHRNFSPLNPGTVKVFITFPGSSYEHELDWNRHN